MNLTHPSFRSPRSGPLFPAILLLLAGCASTEFRHTTHYQPDATFFEKVGVLDLRDGDDAKVRELLQPGDLIVNYMRLGRAAKKREWLFAVLPHGHSMIVLDPADSETGILECRFHGARRVGVDELKLYSYNTVYRLRDPHRLNLDRLREFAATGCAECRKYSFKSWLAFNDNLRPAHRDEISRSYTCSTMVAAAYHYAGVTLEVAHEDSKVITPLSLAASTGRFNEFARPPIQAVARPILAQPNLK
jgi:hypothetical protein